MLDNATGEWLAWEGSGDYFDAAHGGAIDGVVSPRQPGSALKPFTYALGFEQGLTPATVLADIPSHFPTAEAGVLYSPRNYDGRYRGPLLARRALAGSENVPAVALASQLGVPRGAALPAARRLHHVRPQRVVLRPGRHARERGSQARRAGRRATRRSRGAASGSPRPGGRSRPRPERRPHQLVSARTAYWIGDILSDPDAREYIFGRGGNLEFPFPVAVKTGTSQAYHDNWTIGYTRRRDRRRVGRQLRPHAAAGLDRRHRRGADLPRRDAGRAAPRGRDRQRLRATRPSRCVPTDARRTGDLRRCPACPPTRGARRSSASACRPRRTMPAVQLASPERGRPRDDLAGGYREWARRSGLLEERAGAGIGRSGSRGPRAPRPRRARRWRSRARRPARPISSTRRCAASSRRCRCAPSPTAGAGSSGGSTAGRSARRSAESALEWPLAPGTHVISVRDQHGRVAETTVVVR